MNFLIKKEPNPPPWGRSWAQDKSSRLARSAVFRENSKWWTKIHTRLTWVSWVKKVIQQFYWLIIFFGFNWGQSYLATMVMPQNCTKMLTNLTFAVQFAYFSVRPKRKFLFFRATFNQLLEKLREKFWKIASNLWKALSQRQCSSRIPRCSFSLAVLRRWALGRDCWSQ